jgi:hypothetical protein
MFDRLVGVRDKLKPRLAVLSTVFLLVAMGAIALLPSAVTASPGPTMVIDPNVGGKAPGEFYSVNVTVFEVSEVYAWQFNVTFDFHVLEAVSAAEGPFLKTAGNTLFLEPELNNTGGYALVGCTRRTYDAGASGNGVLATITFRVLDEGSSPLELQSSSKLRSWNGSTLVPLSFAMVDGSFSWPLFVLIHDVVVTDVVASPLTVVTGDLVSVNVTVANRGNLTESFDVTLYCGSWVIQSQTVSGLVPGVARTLVFEWDTRDISAGDYVLTAIASTVAQEAGSLDNTFAYPAVTVTEAAPPLPFGLIALLVVVVVLVVISLVLLLKFPGQSHSLPPEKEKAQT